MPLIFSEISPPFKLNFHVHFSLTPKHSSHEKFVPKHNSHIIFFSLPRENSLAKFARSQEDFESTEILLRLSKIQRILQNTCTASRLDKEFESNGNNNYDESTSDLKSLISQMSASIEKLPIKEIKQSFNLNRKHDKTLDAITTTINHIDERTVRIFDTNSYQYKKLLSNFKGTEEEVLTFTNNANILLKKVERTIKQIHEEGRSEKCHNGTQWNEVAQDGSGDSTEVDDEIMDQKGEIKKLLEKYFLSM